MAISPTGPGWRLRQGWLLLLVMLAAPLAGFDLRAQGMEVPASIQVPLMYKILTFDRNFVNRAGEEVVIGILYQQGFRTSVVAREQMEEALLQAGSLLATRKVRWVAIELSEAVNLRQALRQREVDVLYVTPLRGVGLADIFRAAREIRVTTFTGVPEYVERGLAVGIGLEQERPQIVINLPAARSEGADYNAQLLRVSRVIGEGQ